MHLEASIQAKRTTVAHDICHRLESSLVLITGSDLVALGLGAVLPICEQDGDLGAQFRELKRACPVSVALSHSEMRPCALFWILTCDQCDT